MSIDAWVDGALSVLGTPTPEDDSTLPTIVLVGAYNSAKTTLLRRLLTDHDEPIPDWARVSAREETSQVGQVTVAGCVIVDTPGLEALSQWHADESLKALLKADAIALLTTSNLLVTGPSRRSAGEEHLRPIDVLTGRVFAGDGQKYPAGGLAIFITRFDEAGPDPIDFPDQFLAFRDRKIAELQALLGKHLPAGAPPPAVAAVSPDPFGRSRNSDIDRGANDRYRDWDGMRDVEQWLAGIREHSRDLASWRRVRRLTFGLTERQQQLAEDLEVKRKALASLNSGLAQTELRATRCRREHAAAEARLRAAIEQAVYAAPDPTNDNFKAELRQLLVRGLTEWADGTAATLAMLIDEAQVDLATHPVAASGAERAAGALMSHLDDGSPAWQEATTRLQSGIKVVKSGLDALSVDHSGQPSVADPGGPALLGLSPERVGQLSLLLTVAEAMLNTAQEQGISVRAPQREAHRAQLLKQADVVAEQMFTSASAPFGWQGMFATLQAASEDALGQLAHAREQVSHEVDVQEAELADVRDLLASRPAPPSY